MGIQINGQNDTISAVDNSFSLAGNVSNGGTSGKTFNSSGRVTGWAQLVRIIICYNINT